MTLPTNRTTANTAAEHVADHNTLHGEFNVPTHTHSGALGRLTLRRVASQALANATLVAISWDTEDIDSSGFWTSGDTVTIPSGQGGIYACTLRANLGGTVTGARTLLDLVFSNAGIYRAAFGNAEDSGSVSWTGYLAAADTITTSLYQTTGGALTIDGARLELVKLAAV